MAELDDEYIAKMEDVLETYEKPYDPQQPVVCLDEKRLPCMPTSGLARRRNRGGNRDETTNMNAAAQPMFSAR